MPTTLFDILSSIEILDATGPDPRHVAIGAIRFDSRQVQPGDLFVAVRGAGADGHDFIQKALENGAAAVVCEQQPAVADPAPALVRVADSAEALGRMAANYYGRPSEQIGLVGVTGTNGKTTVTTLLWQCFSRLGYRCGLIGTVENRVGDQIVPSTHTTPDAVSLQALLRQMADAGCAYVFMETSSHAIHQRRIAGANFAGAVFTNLTHDHLDYHGTFAAYRDAKKRLFDDLPAQAFALTNADDRNGKFMLQNTRAKTFTYGLKTSSTFKAKIIENALNGLHLRLDDEDFHARMIGEFNAYNLLAVYGVARLLGIDKHAALTALSDLRGAEGRFDYVVHPSKNGCIGIVDYAHTPDAVEKVLETIQQLKKRGAKVITVIGCGGDRDKTKRPLMARVAARLSDQAILTSDNPRTEDPQAILHDMEAGLSPEDQQKTLTIENREQAIKTAERFARPGDIILVAGKGHEKYQDIKGVKYPFDDRAMLERMMKEG
ncbi:MAG TPA: UDP-N-acetylmuramoyl-L-alanyl-D-glutamate--2,6-diaminopimelate ligase [Saprospiraceae bacterium]|nr:UDP-N-acetylmuramoyl-L-alanyl-D-glutamate--2,6-diaminopimelate ligase [Saprospiraceae bacterium]